MIRIILIRHGHTAWNLAEGQGRRFRGIIDLPLADEGVTQAQATAQRLADWPLTAIYSSPLQRAARTAQIIAEPHDLSAQPLPGLGSMNYGEWAGRFYVDVARRWPELYQQWRCDPFSIQIPGGESTVALRDRAVTTLRTILTRHDEGDTIALVSHQVVTKTLACVLGGLPNTAYWQVRQDLCNLSRFDYDPTTDEFTVVGLNDTCHLSPALPHAAGGVGSRPSAPGNGLWPQESGRNLPGRLAATCQPQETGFAPKQEAATELGGTRIVLVRHGQTAWNAGAGDPTLSGERFRGHTDLPLDNVGQAQARAVANRLKNEPISALYASPLLRTQQTAAPLADALCLPAQRHEGLIDINYGRFQGLTHSEAAAAYPVQAALWRTRPSQVHFPDGENLPDVQIRLLALLEEMAVRHPDSAEGKTIVLIGHQIVNKVLACTLLGLDLDQIWRIRQDTCSFDLFQHVGTHAHWRGTLTLCLNDTCHLSGLSSHASGEL